MHRRSYRAALLVVGFLLALAGCSGASTTPTQTGTFLAHYWTTNLLEANTDCGRRGLGISTPYPDPIHGTGTGPSPTADAHAAGVLVGFDHSHDGDCSINSVLRGGVQFDLASRTTPVFQALLHLRTTRTRYLSADDIGLQISCAGALKAADADFSGSAYDATSSTALLPASDFVALPVFDPAKGAPAPIDGVSTTYIDSTKAGLGTPQGLYFTVNVTGQVNEWIAGTAPNRGFVLAGRDERTDAAENNTCLSYYDGFELDLFDLK